MRDTIGNEKDFITQIESIEYHMENIPDKLKELQTFNPNLQFDYLRITKEDPINYRSLFYLNYSLGNDLHICFDYYQKWIKFYNKLLGNSKSYELFGVITILSICAFYINKKDLLEENLQEVISKTELKNDFFLNELYFYLFNKKLSSDELKYSAKYFEKIFKNRDIKTIKEVLEKEWYKSNKNAYWYDTHNLENNCYQGYWAWDIGAAVKILGLDDSELKDCKYYPYDLVHYCD